MNYYGFNRSLCSVLEEMRSLHKTRNYSALLSLIEEAQSLGNRMEAALRDQKDIKNLSVDCAKLRKEYKDLKAKV